MKKNFHYRSKVLFWSGVSMLVLAGLVWLANGGIGKIKTAFATDQGASSCSTAGCYSEQWSASQVFGTYKVSTTSGSNWVSAVGVPVSSHALVSNDGATTGLTFSATVSTGKSTQLYSAEPAIVTQWTVNGHVH
jgi:hypothetical protein